MWNELLFRTGCPLTAKAAPNKRPCHDMDLRERQVIHRCDATAEAVWRLGADPGMQVTIGGPHRSRTSAFDRCRHLARVAEVVLDDHVCVCEQLGRGLDRQTIVEMGADHV